MSVSCQLVLGLLLSISAVIINSKPLHHETGLGIYNGDIVSWKDYPYIASLRYNYDEGYASEHCCAASIISLDPPFALTSAHCVFPDPDDRQCNREIIIGCDHVQCDNDEATVYEIDAFSYHPQFVHLDHYDEPPQYDIALLKLYPIIDKPDGVRNISLSQSDPCCEELHPLTVLGYGRTRALSIYSDLRNGTTNWLRSTECDEITNTAYYNYESMFCFMDEWDVEEEMVTVCAGDNGGPVVDSLRDEMLVGITSWEWTNFVGYVCNATAPQTAASIGNMYPWIINEMERLSKN